MANTTKNRLFYWDMGYNKTQGKTMPMLGAAFVVQDSTPKNSTK